MKFTRSLYCRLILPFLCKFLFLVFARQLIYIIIILIVIIIIIIIIIIDIILTSSSKEIAH